MEEKKEVEITNPIEAVDFLISGKKFRYDFRQLTTEQSTLAWEACQFKLNTIEAPPESFNQLIKSGATDWLFMTMGYLLREVIGDNLTNFDRDYAESKVFDLVKNSPAFENEARFKECIRDFFCNIGQDSLNSRILLREKERSAMPVLLPLMIRTLLGNGNISSNII